MHGLYNGWYSVALLSHSQKVLGSTRLAYWGVSVWGLNVLFNHVGYLCVPWFCSTAQRLADRSIKIKL